MTAPSPQPLRPISAIAADILSDINQRSLRKVLPPVVAMAKLQSIDSVEAYSIVASARQALGQWRSVAARSIKYELDRALTHFRVDHG